MIGPQHPIVFRGSGEFFYQPEDEPWLRGWLESIYRRGVCKEAGHRYEDGSCWGYFSFQDGFRHYRGVDPWRDTAGEFEAAPGVSRGGGR